MSTSLLCNVTGYGCPEVDTMTQILDVGGTVLGSGYFYTAILCCYVAYVLHFYEFSWRKEEFKGLTINVREPREGGWGAKPEQFPFAWRNNIFWNFFFMHFSAVVVGFECMLSKLTTHLDAPGVAGMLSQEMNHACMQTLMNMSFEKATGIPALTWQRNYSRFFQLFPDWVSKGFVACVEAGFLMMDSPIVRNFFFENLPEPVSLWCMHLVEEGEHSWSSVHDLQGQLSLPLRILSFIWYALVLFGVLVLSQIHAFYYGWKMIFLQGHIVKLPIFLAQVLVLILNLVIGVVATFILSMEMSDEAYERHHAFTFMKYQPYQHFFRITHRQKPDNELARRKSFANPTGDGSRVSVYLYSQQKRMSFHQGHMQAPKDETKPAFEEDKKVLAMRTIAYEKAKSDLIKMGLKEDQVGTVFMEDLGLMDTLPEGDLPQGPIDAEETKIEESGDNKEGKSKLPGYTQLDVMRITSKPGVIWIILKGMVVDVSKFADEHPGGVGPLDAYKGKDATKVFMCIHDQKKVRWSKYVVGKLIGKATDFS